MFFAPRQRLRITRQSNRASGCASDPAQRLRITRQNNRANGCARDPATWRTPPRSHAGLIVATIDKAIASVAASAIPQRGERLLAPVVASHASLIGAAIPHYGDRLQHGDCLQYANSEPSEAFEGTPADSPRRIKQPAADGAMRKGPATRVANCPRPWRCRRHAFAAHAQHVGDQLLGHHEVGGGESVHAQQQPAAQLLIERMVAVAHGGLRHLRDERLRVAQQQMNDGR